ncbi:DNA repair metallo-beta-lactamase-domain-containing protein [Scheffersomyces xylosifermentans]|uniref:DNA repair metallo-beta-lactamase-domain-containing protein n=1 Tax=Scheffersomyces xylosifermentans TaxID=1304137 RepID=UPI00315D868C
MNSSSSSQKPGVSFSTSKRQSSILEFTSTRDLQISESSSTATTVVDLTAGDEPSAVDSKLQESPVKYKAEYDSLDFGEFIEDVVSCPICSTNITYFAFDDRTRHVEICLATLTRKESAQVKQEPSTKRRKKSEPTIPKEKLKYMNQRKTEAFVVNKIENDEIMVLEEADMQIKQKKIKLPKPPTTISVSRQRNQIPRLKIMTFPVTPVSSYEVSVDAFSFAPHNTIDQYFLSHFHSDHYGGISKKWSYERVFKSDSDYENDAKYRKIIYCTKITSRLLTLRFSIDPRFIKDLEMDTRYFVKAYSTSMDSIGDLPDGGCPSESKEPGLYVTPITANHCPGSALFLFESYGIDGRYTSILHCGDFRVNKTIMQHPRLKRFNIESQNFETLDKVYLDTTYMSPKYNFPKQELVCDTIADMFHDLIYEEASEDKEHASDSLFSKWFGVFTQKRITDFLRAGPVNIKKKKFLVLVGTYVIGKERLAIAISRRLKCPIYVSTINSRSDKLDIIRTYDDEYLDSVLVTDDLGGDDSECVVHLVPMTIVGSSSELCNYFNHNRYFEYFERCVGLRPTGWTFVPGSRGIEPSNAEEELEGELLVDKINPDANHLSQLLALMKSEPSFTYMKDILPQAPLPKAVSKQKGSHDKSLYRIYSLPYSEHSSFRELAYFSIFINTKEIIPTVNEHNPDTLKLMTDIIKTWESARELKLKGANASQEGGIDSKLAQMFEELTLDDF